jgi:hypothetical protein
MLAPLSFELLGVFLIQFVVMVPAINFRPLRKNTVSNLGAHENSRRFHDKNRH